MISIIVPIYNAEKYLDECIKSVLSQDFKDWELILVDDGSTDESVSVASRYVDGNKIRLISKQNQGVTFTRWRGVKDSKGEWLMFLDADDMLTPDALSGTVAYMDNSTDIVVFGIQTVRNADEMKAASSGSVRHESHRDANWCADKILKGNFLSCVTRGCYRRNMILQQEEIFCNGLRIAEDTMFNLQLILRTNPNIKLLDSRPYCYRINPTSVTRAVTLSRFDAVKDAIDYICRFEKRYPQCAKKLARGFAFRKLLLWSTYMFNPNNRYYDDISLRSDMRKSYIKAFPYLYPYLKIYLFVDLFICKNISQHLIRRKSKQNGLHNQ